MAKLGFKDYLRAAFHAKPRGWLLSPNYILLGAFGLLGILASPGFLVIGAGVELGYLFTLLRHKRFQRWVDAVSLSQKQAGWKANVDLLLDQLWPVEKKRFHAVQQRCASVMEFYTNFLNVDAAIVQQHSQSLNRLAWIFLQLLLTKQAVSRIVKENTYTARLEKEAVELEQQIADPKINPDLKKSLEGKRDILKQRLNILGEAENKLLYIDSELDRIEQQIELIREQAVISKDSQALSTRIDSVSSTLGETTEWIKQQQSLFGSAQDLLEEPPQIVMQPPQAE